MIEHDVMQLLGQVKTSVVVFVQIQVFDTEGDITSEQQVSAAAVCFCIGGRTDTLFHPESEVQRQRSMVKALGVEDQSIHKD